MIKSLLLSGLVLLAGHEAEAACSLVKVAELHISIENNQILIPGELEGNKVKFLFDSSFPASLITSNGARKMGLTVLPFSQALYSGNTFANIHSREDAGYIRTTKMSLDNHDVAPTSIGVFSPNDNFGGPEVLGVLGSDFWSGYDVELDLPHNRINLLHAKDCEGHNLAYWGNDYNVMQPSLYGLRTEVQITLNGHEVTAMIDSGSPYSTITERAAARLGVKRGDARYVFDDIPPNVQRTDIMSLVNFSHGLGLYRGPSPEVRLQGMPDIEPIAGPTGYWIARFDQLKIDEETISPMGFRVVRTPPAIRPETGSRIPGRLVDYDILLGVDFLKAHRMLFSNSQGKLYFTYTGGTDFAMPH